MTPSPGVPARLLSRRTLHRAAHRALAGAVVALAAACAPEPAPEPPPPPAIPDNMQLSPVGFDALPGWSQDRVIAALPALRRSCDKFAARPNPQAWLGPGPLGGTVGEWQELCRDLDRALPRGEADDAAAFRTFLEARFTPYAVRDGNGTETGDATGTFTGYYEAELAGCLRPTPACNTPLYGLPPDLVSVNLGKHDPALKGVTVVGRVDGTRLVPYPTRADIEDGALDGIAPVIAWAADPVDAHILHIQGSGRLVLPDGEVIRVGYAGNNGHRFRGIGGIMLERGLLEPGKASMPHIRAWLQAHPDEADAIMRENPRYIFFRRIEGDGPIGAMGVPLTPRRSLAVDTRYLPLGVPVWLDSVDPDGQPLQRLMVAQDVGAAIKGVVRGDFFWGPGEAALAEAGRMKSPGRWFVLLPASRSPAT